MGYFINQSKNKTKEKRFHLSPILFKNQLTISPLIIFLPFEPTLFPKLQVYFADFPNPRFAI